MLRHEDADGDRPVLRAPRGAAPAQAAAEARHGPQPAGVHCACGRRGRGPASTGRGGHWACVSAARAVLSPPLRAGEVRLAGVGAGPRGVRHACERRAARPHPAAGHGAHGGHHRRVYLLLLVRPPAPASAPTSPSHSRLSPRATALPRTGQRLRAARGLTRASSKEPPCVPGGRASRRSGSMRRSSPSWRAWRRASGTAAKRNSRVGCRLPSGCAGLEGGLGRRAAAEWPEPRLPPDLMI